MNRRHKKKQQVDYVELAKAKLSAFDGKIVLARLKNFWQGLPRLHRRIISVLAPLICILALLPAPKPSIKSPVVNERVELSINTQSLSEQQSTEQSSLKSESWREYTVKNGDTLSQVFRNNSLPMTDLNALVKIEGSDKPLSQIKKGQLVRFKLASDGNLDILQLEKGSSSVMFFRLSDGGFGRSK
ncbi:LysM-like peptidoglycan-binding domain-containing protein [Vibrio genomosp. F6]|uniref:Lysine transporter LysM n=1 Tax=Vibrio genomosp. F6 str. FF-238 TaxID=1191298 RepID=A0A1E5CVU6_9VIBR|nr:LysM-like peptidoglycan-binding domain-containing protein [Vibrio genomosp. F6]OEE73692.1 lysine transporter LysM [Vibrio genomosp. F6 str. FF-238]